MKHIFMHQKMGILFLVGWIPNKFAKRGFFDIMVGESGR
jgi:hypothetical protein